MEKKGEKKSVWAEGVTQVVELATVKPWAQTLVPTKKKWNQNIVL
jgi:hypothetical protein